MEEHTAVGSRPAHDRFVVGEAWLLAGIMLMLVSPPLAGGWTPLPVAEDPLIRMPGSQHGTVALEASSNCLSCHTDYGMPDADPGANWQGSMMGQSARDFLFWPTMVVAMQDSIWAIGRPNAADLCIRCHFPSGWLGGRSDPVNVSRMTGADFDGVSCHFCHQMVDPFFEDTYHGVREGDDWVGYWDEATAASATAALTTYQADIEVSDLMTFMNGLAFYDAAHQPGGAEYTEAAGGQFYVGGNLSARRASFVDANPSSHTAMYSRFHRSKYFCGTCHDVSNAVLANLGEDGTEPLPSETTAAHQYWHVERTFSEFMSSAYGLPGGAPGSGAFAPDRFDTAKPGDVIATCQDCHMAPVPGKAAKQQGAVMRPSAAHPKSGVPRHDFAGANIFVPTVLASSVPGSPVYDAVNDALLNQGPAELTLDLTQGLGLNPGHLINVAARARSFLEMAATLEDLDYDPVTGRLRFRVVNHTGHKLITGYPEGRRMFVQIRCYRDGTLIHHVNPYDDFVSTLKGLDAAYSPDSPALAPHEVHLDALVYECQMGSLGLLGTEKTFHFALATERYKDNRIPPRGFRPADAGPRLTLPVHQGIEEPDAYTADEYAGGYDQVDLWVARRADEVQVALYYQSTSREYIAFLRDEINGTASTLSSPTPSGEPEAYVIQTDPFFANLTAWGDTVWQLWEHNRSVPGAAPVPMTETNAVVAWDSDGDGIPDAWEIMHSGSLTNMNEQTDIDGDGFLDLHEFIADTSPTNASSFLSLDATITNPPHTDEVTLTWDSRPNRVYQVQRTKSLPAGFTNLSLRLPATPPQNQYPDALPASGRAFYRIAVED